MRIFLYCLITQIIIWLAKLRKYAVKYKKHSIKNNRIFDVYEEETWACCDCGLEHYFRHFQNNETCSHQQEHINFKIVGHCMPIRPKEYKYNLRHGAVTPSLAKDN